MNLSPDKETCYKECWSWLSSHSESLNKLLCHILSRTGKWNNLVLFKQDDDLSDPATLTNQNICLEHPLDSMIFLLNYAAWYKYSVKRTDPLCKVTILKFFSIKGAWNVKSHHDHVDIATCKTISHPIWYLGEYCSIIINVGFYACKVCTRGFTVAIEHCC